MIAINPQGQANQAKDGLVELYESFDRFRAADVGLCCFDGYSGRLVRCNEHF